MPFLTRSAPCCAALLLACLAAPAFAAPAGNAPAGEAPDLHDHTPATSARRTQRLRNRPADKAATPTERELQARIDRTITALSLQADHYWHEGDYKGVAFCNRMITQLDPKDILAWSDLGWILWAGLYDEKGAEQALRAGVAANPDRHDLYFDLGFYLHRRKRYQEAAAVLAKGVRFKDADAVTWNQYAHSLEKAGKPQRAAEVWRTMRTRFPDNPSSQVNLDRLKRHGLL